MFTTCCLLCLLLPLTPGFRVEKGASVNLSRLAPIPKCPPSQSLDKLPKRKLLTASLTLLPPPKKRKKKKKERKTRRLNLRPGLQDQTGSPGVLWIISDSFPGSVPPHTRENSLIHNLKALFRCLHSARTWKIVERE